MLAAGASPLQFFPLTIFVYVAFSHGQPQAEDWLNAFLAGGAIAGLQLILANILSRGHPLSRLLLGVNVYLIMGGIAVLTNQLVVLYILNDLRESGIFLTILVVGVLTTLGSKAGFVGEENRLDPPQVKRYSLGLLVLTSIATAASFYFRGYLIFSAVIPLITLTVANKLIKNLLRRCSVSNSSQ